MKKDLNSLKKELGRLTDINYIKKELNRVAGDVKKFDMHINLTPQSKQRLEKLERRFRGLLKNLQDLQKQLDTKMDRFIGILRRKPSVKKRRSSTKASTAKASTKAAVKSAKKPSKKTSRKTASKS